MLPSHEVTPAPLGLAKKKRPRFVRFARVESFVGKLKIAYVLS